MTQPIRDFKFYHLLLLACKNTVAILLDDPDAGWFFSEILYIFFI